jgi:MFS family permease
MPQLYVVGFLAGSLAVVFDLSWNTLFVSVTARDRYVEAMALLNGSRSLATVGGPTIGGLLVQLLGAPVAMLADGFHSMFDGVSNVVGLVGVDPSRAAKSMSATRS